MLKDTAGGQALGRRGAAGFGALLGLTAAFVALCLWIWPGVLASEAFLENPDVGQVAGTGGPAGARTPVLGLVAKDGKYVARDLILLGQLGTTLILFFVPFLLNIAQESLTAADKDIFGDLALGMLGLIAYMLTSILSLTSVGLEGRAGWIVLASPLGRGAFLRAKWLLSFGLSWATVATLAVVDGLAFGWGFATLTGALAALGCACFALSGLGVGLSGLFPRFVYENPAHRASVWALILGFVLATGYLIACGLIAGVGYVAVTQGALAVNTVITAGLVAFILVSAATGLVPVALAARRLRDYEWEI